MYNRYLNTASEERPRLSHLHTESPPPRCEPPEPPCPPHGKAEGSGLLSGLSDALSGRLKNLHFDLDTLVIIIAVYFLIADSEDFDTDLLVLIGVLFVVGL